MNIDSTVKKETVYISLGVIIMSLLMESVFLIIGYWNLSVLFGNLLGAFGAIGNFLLMGITIQKAVERDEKHAAGLMRLSQTLRLFALFLIALIGCLVPGINLAAVLIPLFFPRIVIAFRPLFIHES